MILVDTSVWIDHVRHTNRLLTTLLLNDHVLIHPFAIEELACGNLKQREVFLDLLHKLPVAIVASHQEIIDFIARYHLFGKGLGAVDMHLLASAKLSGARLFSFDKTLSHQARLLHMAMR